MHDGLVMHSGHGAEVAKELRRGRIQSPFDVEKAAEWARGRPAIPLGPRYDHLVANVLVDLAAVVVHGVGGQEEDPVQELVNAYRPYALSKRSGTGEVHEEKEALFLPRPVVASQHPVTQRPATNDLADLEYEDKHRCDHEREDQRDDLRGARLDRNADQASPWLEEVHQGHHRAVDGDLNRQRHEKGRLLHGASRLRADPEDLQPADRGADQEAVSRANERPPARGIVHGEMQRDAVGGADQGAEDDHLGNE